MKKVLSRLSGKATSSSKSTGDAPVARCEAATDNKKEPPVTAADPSGSDHRTPAGNPETERADDTCPAYDLDARSLSGLARLVWLGDTSKVRALTARSSAGLRAKDKQGRSLLHLAAARGHPELVDLLLAKHVPRDDADKQGNTPLIKAVEAGSLVTVSLLLELDADPTPLNASGLGALHVSVQRDAGRITEQLLKHGVDSDQLTADGLSALHVVAAVQSSGQSAAALLRHGASVTLTDPVTGDTPLHLAAAAGNTQLTELLIENGAEPHARNAQGLSPVDLAARDGHDTVLTQIRRLSRRHSSITGLLSGVLIAAETGPPCFDDKSPISSSAETTPVFGRDSLASSSAGLVKSSKIPTTHVQETRSAVLVEHEAVLETPRKKNEEGDSDSWDDSDDIDFTPSARKQSVALPDFITSSLDLVVPGPAESATGSVAGGTTAVSLNVLQKPTSASSRRSANMVLSPDPTDSGRVSAVSELQRSAPLVPGRRDELDEQEEDGGFAEDTDGLALKKIQREEVTMNDGNDSWDDSIGVDIVTHVGAPSHDVNEDVQNSLSPGSSRRSKGQDLVSSAFDPNFSDLDAAHRRVSRTVDAQTRRNQSELLQSALRAANKDEFTSIMSVHSVTDDAIAVARPQDEGQQEYVFTQNLKFGIESSKSSGFPAHQKSGNLDDVSVDSWDESHATESESQVSNAAGGPIVDSREHGDQTGASASAIRPSNKELKPAASVNTSVGSDGWEDVYGTRGITKYRDKDDSVGDKLPGSDFQEKGFAKPMQRGSIIDSWDDDQSSGWPVASESKTVGNGVPSTSGTILQGSSVARVEETVYVPIDTDRAPESRSGEVPQPVVRADDSDWDSDGSGREDVGVDDREVSLASDGTNDASETAIRPTKDDEKRKPTLCVHHDSQYKSLAGTLGREGTMNGCEEIWEQNSIVTKSASFQSGDDGGCSVSPSHAFAEPVQEPPSPNPSIHRSMETRIIVKGQAQSSKEEDPADHMEEVASAPIISRRQSIFLGQPHQPAGSGELKKRTDDPKNPAAPPRRRSRSGSLVSLAGKLSGKHSERGKVADDPESVIIVHREDSPPQSKSGRKMNRLKKLIMAPLKKIRRKSRSHDNLGLPHSRRASVSIDSFLSEGLTAELAKDIDNDESHIVSSDEREVRLWETGDDAEHLSLRSPSPPRLTAGTSDHTMHADDQDDVTALLPRPVRRQRLRSTSSSSARSLPGIAEDDDSIVVTTSACSAVSSQLTERVIPHRRRLGQLFSCEVLPEDDAAAALAAPPVAPLRLLATGTRRGGGGGVTRRHSIDPDSLRRLEGAGAAFIKQLFDRDSPDSDSEDDGSTSLEKQLKLRTSNLDAVHISDADYLQTTLRELRRLLDTERSRRKRLQRRLDSARQRMNEELVRQSGQTAGTDVNHSSDCDSPTEELQEKLGLLRASLEEALKHLLEEQSKREASEQRQQELSAGCDRHQLVVAQLRGELDRLTREAEARIEQVRQEFHSRRLSSSPSVPVSSAAKGMEDKSTETAHGRQLAMEADTLKEEIEQLIQEQDQLTDKRDDLHNELKNLATKRDQMTAEFGALETGVNQLVTERNRLTVERDQLTAEGDQFTAGREQSTAKREQPTVERDQLTVERDRLTAERDELTTERDQLTVERDRLTTERDQLTVERDQLTAERDDRNTERDQLTVERDQLITERDQFTVERDQFTAERDELTTERDQRTLERDRLIARCDELSVRCTSQNVESLSAAVSSVPTAGAVESNVTDDVRELKFSVGRLTAENTQLVTERDAAARELDRLSSQQDEVLERAVADVHRQLESGYQSETAACLASTRTELQRQISEATERAESMIASVQSRLESEYKEQLEKRCAEVQSEADARVAQAQAQQMLNAEVRASVMSLPLREDNQLLKEQLTDTRQQLEETAALTEQLRSSLQKAETRLEVRETELGTQIETLMNELQNRGVKETSASSAIGNENAADDATRALLAAEEWETQLAVIRSDLENVQRVLRQELDVTNQLKAEHVEALAEKDRAAAEQEQELRMVIAQLAEARDLRLADNLVSSMSCTEGQHADGGAGRLPPSSPIQTRDRSEWKILQLEGQVAHLAREVDDLKCHSLGDARMVQSFSGVLDGDEVPSRDVGVVGAEQSHCRASVEYQTAVSNCGEEQRRSDDPTNSAVNCLASQPNCGQTTGKMENSALQSTNYDQSEEPSTGGGCRAHCHRDVLETPSAVQGTSERLPLRYCSVPPDDRFGLPTFDDVFQDDAHPAGCVDAGQFSVAGGGHNIPRDRKSSTAGQTEEHRPSCGDLSPEIITSVQTAGDVRLAPDSGYYTPSRRKRHLSLDPSGTSNATYNYNSPPSPSSDGLRMRGGQLTACVRQERRRRRALQLELERIGEAAVSGDRRQVAVVQQTTVGEHSAPGGSGGSYHSASVEEIVRRVVDEELVRNRSTSLTDDPRTSAIPLYPQPNCLRSDFYTVATTGRPAEGSRGRGFANVYSVGNEHAAQEYPSYHSHFTSPGDRLLSALPDSSCSSPALPDFDGMIAAATAGSSCRRAKRSKRNKHHARTVQQSTGKRDEFNASRHISELDDAFEGCPGDVENVATVNASTTASATAEVIQARSSLATASVEELLQRSRDRYFTTLFNMYNI